MSIAVFILFIIAVLYLNYKRRSSVWLLLGWLLISPNMSIGIVSFDSTYLVDIVLFIYIALRRRIKYSFPPIKCRKYLLMLVSVNILYLISWALFNRKDAFSMISAFLGSLKIVILLIECWNINKKYISIDFIHEIEKTILFVAAVNTIAIIYELVDFSGSVAFLQSNWLGAQSISYLQDTIKWGYYVRYFGVMGYPMHLGLFAGYSITFLLLNSCYIKKLQKAVLIIDLIIIGILSGSKSFVFTMALGVVFFAIISLRSNKKKKCLYSITAIFFSIIFLISLPLVQNIVSSVFGERFSRYFSFFYNIRGIFDTRIGNSGFLSTSRLYDVIMSNIIFGVGTSSIYGEPVMDNAFLIILHNGGLLSLVIILGWYIKSILSNINERAYICLLIVIIISGMGFETLTSSISAWIIFPYLIALGKKSRAWELGRKNC